MTEIFANDSHRNLHKFSSAEIGEIIMEKNTGTLEALCILKF